MDIWAEWSEIGGDGRGHASFVRFAVWAAGGPNIDNRAKDSSHEMVSMLTLMSFVRVPRED